MRLHKWQPSSINGYISKNVTLKSLLLINKILFNCIADTYKGEKMIKKTIADGILWASTKS